MTRSSLVLATYRTLLMIWTSSGRPNSVASTASAAAFASVVTRFMSSATHPKSPTFVPYVPGSHACSASVRSVSLSA